MLALTAIICSHNPQEDYLRRVLAALRAQTLPVAEWELLLVDNASEEPLAGRFDISWHPRARRVREERIGPIPARLRGIAESQGNLLVFVGDDTVLRADYFQASLKISADHPWLGVWNGSCIPEFEAEPSAELRPFLWAFLTEKLEASLWARLPMDGPALPTGLGMAVRRPVAERYLHDPVRQALGRNGKMPAAAADSDIALTAFQLGLAAGRFPELELTRLISARQVTLNYLEPLFERIGYGGAILNAIHRDAHGESGAGRLKALLLRLGMIAARKSRAERRIRLAEARGQAAARQDLQNLNFTR